jgi:hypothetical protein
MLLVLNVVLMPFLHLLVDEVLEWAALVFGLDLVGDDISTVGVHGAVGWNTELLVLSVMVVTPVVMVGGLFSFIGVGIGVGIGIGIGIGLFTESLVLVMMTEWALNNVFSGNVSEKG